VFQIKPGRRGWLQVARGAISLNGTALNAGDGAAASDEEILETTALEEAELLLFDLA
jgi:redox-sensitive bicupin YhaK (pirin superfamily)